MLKGEMLPNFFNRTSLVNSHSASNIFSINDYKTKFFNNQDITINKFAKTPRQFSIYSNSKIFKSPLDYQNYKSINNLRKKNIFEQNFLVNSYHKLNIRKKFNQLFQNFYLTSLKDNQKFNEIDNNIISYRNYLNQTGASFKNKIYIENNDNSKELSSKANSFFSTKIGFNIKKRNFILGKIMNDYKSPRNLINYCNKIAVMKKIEINDKNRITDFIDKKQNIKELLDNYYCKLQRNQQIYMKNFEIIYVKYIKYLRDLLDNEKIKLDKLKEKKKKISLTVLSLKTLIEKENENLIELIDVRDFLIKVKEKTLKLNPLLQKMLNKEKLNKKQINSLDKMVYERYLNYLDKSIPIFQNTEEFFYIFSDIEEQNINLLLKLEKIQISVEQLKNELIEIKESEDRINDILEIQIKSKQEIRDDLYNHYKYFISQKKHLIQIENREKDIFLNYKSTSLSHIKYLNDDKYFMTLLQYRNILSQYPIQFSYFFVKLGEGVKLFLNNNLLSISNMNKIAQNKKDLENFLTVDEKSDKENNYDRIVSKCVKLLFFYEEVVDKILQKNLIYLNNLSYKDDLQIAILKRRNEIKQRNAKERRIVLERKRKYEINKIVEKNNKIRIGKILKSNSWFNYNIEQSLKKLLNKVDGKKKKDKDKDKDSGYEYFEY